ncbi:MAG: oligosaccharide flippase family protein [Chitinivibrionales bacterium]|nr:oligosaccharide flippase family protein [Chitinivibrionales bacterium]MBD3355721.1 oligosaccharide flippase family protein [Chitinivibrionales bacterium]
MQKALRITGVIFSKQFKDCAVMVIGRPLSAGLGFFVNMILARKLGPEDFGLYYLAITTMMLTGQFCGGSIAQAVVRFHSHYVTRNPERAALMFKVALKVILAVGGSLSVTGLCLSRPVAELITGSSASAGSFAFAFVGTLGLSLFQFVLAVYQAHESFRRHMLLELLNNFLKFVFIGILIAVHGASPTLSVLAYATTPFVVATIGAFRIPKNFMRATGAEKQVFGELIRFSKWMMLSFVLFSIYGRIDIVLLNRFKGTTQGGVYAAATVFTLALEILAFAVFTVILPRVSRLTTPGELRGYARRILAVTFPLTLLVNLVLLVTLRPLVLSILSERYAPTIIILRTLIPASSTFLIALPLTTIIMALNRPRLLAFMDFAVLIAVVGGCAILIPRFGAPGAAWAVLGSKLLFLAMVLYFSFAITTDPPARRGDDPAENGSVPRSSHSYPTTHSRNVKTCAQSRTL